MLSFRYSSLMTCSFDPFRKFAYFNYTRLQNIWRANIWLVFFNFFELTVFSFLQFSIFCPLPLLLRSLAAFHFSALTHNPLKVLRDVFLLSPPPVCSMEWFIIDQGTSLRKAQWGDIFCISIARRRPASFSRPTLCIVNAPSGHLYHMDDRIA